MSDLDPEAFNHFKEIPCDKCGSVCAYSNPEEVTECFGCKCKTLEENDVHCKCGWHGRWFKDVPYDENLQGRCPKCKSPLQTIQTLDSDDKIVSEKRVCKKQFPNKKKKGCGFSQIVKL